MTTCARVLIAAAVGGCHHPPGARERALERTSGDAQVVVVADGPALAEPAFRRALDATRPHVPASFGCVIDAALASDASALALDRNAGIAVVIITQAHVACAALSQIAGDTWAATIGAATPVERASSVLASTRWARARPFLLEAPVVVAADLGTRHLIGAACIAPVDRTAPPFGSADGRAGGPAVDAWLAIDAMAGAVPDREVGELLGSWHASSLAAKLDVTHLANQIVVHGKGLDGDDLATAAATIAHALDVPRSAAPVALVCPPSGVLRCTEGTHFVVASLGDALRAMAAAAEPVVANGEVIGIRLAADATLALRRGDLIIGLDAHRITSSAELATLIAGARGHATLAIRRGGSDVVFDVRE